jgi:hypothetical protein
MTKHQKESFRVNFAGSFSKSTAFLFSWILTHDDEDNTATKAYKAQLRLRGFY